MDITEFTRQIGENVRIHRERAGLTQAELAERVDVGTSFISRVESGKKSMKLITLYAVAEALGVSCDALLYPESSSVHINTIIKLLQGKPDHYLAGIETLIRTCGVHFAPEPVSSPEGKT